LLSAFSSLAYPFSHAFVFSSQLFQFVSVPVNYLLLVVLSSVLAHQWVTDQGAAD